MDRDTYMRFTGLSVGSLDLQARQVCRMSVGDITDCHKVDNSEPMVAAVGPEYHSDMEAYSSNGEEEAECLQENSDEFN